MRYMPRYLIIVIAVFCFAWLMPYFYNIAARKSVDRPILYYSAIVDDFLYVKSNRYGPSERFDMSGNSYTQREYAKLLPFIYGRDLRNWGEYPDTIAGVQVPVEKAVNERDFVRLSPHYIDMERVRIQLFPLFESESDFSTIEMPESLFRITNRMEFVNGAANRIDEEKSVKFTAALIDKGFAFPASVIAGNPTTLKPYDCGYFVLDFNGEMFHIYQAKGEPVVKKIEINPNLKIAYIGIEENYYLPYYGLIVTENGEIYQLLKDGYRLHEVYTANYNPFRDVLFYSFDPLNITARIIGETDTNVYVTDRAGNLIKGYSQSFERNIRFPFVYDTVFPFVLRRSPYLVSGLLDLTLSKKLLYSIMFSVIITVAYAVFRLRRKGFEPLLPADLAIVFIGGIYGLTAILLLTGVRR